jgi:hypothetical protein
MKNIGIIGGEASKTGSAIYKEGKRSLNSINDGLSATGDSISNEAKEINKGFKSLKGLFGHSKKDEK